MRRPLAASITFSAFAGVKIVDLTRPTSLTSQAIDIPVSLHSSTIATMSDEKTPLDPPPSYDDGVQKQTPAGGAAPPRRGPLPLNLPALNVIRGKRVILASGSPRRKQLLAQVRFSCPSNLTIDTTG